MCELTPFALMRGQCDRCGYPLVGRQKRWCSKTCEKAFWNQHYWPVARKLALKRDRWRCVRCGARTALEVNHIVPRVGRGYTADCGHHLANLETLCHSHHLIVTAHQRAERKALR